jgi:hypothetical protein
MGINLTISDIPFQIALSVLYITIIISIAHYFLCWSNIYSWKFAFLLPGDTSYYIIVSNKGHSCIQDEEIAVKLPEGSVLIRSKPDHKWCESSFENGSKYREDFERILKDSKCFHAGILADRLASHVSDTSKWSLWINKTGKLSSGESESYVLWLHTKKNRTLIPIDIKNKSLDLTISHCDWANGDMGRLGALYLLLSKNVILLLIRSLVLAFLFLCILWQNPPLNIVTDPLQIKENCTAGDGGFVTISVKNAGCNLSQADLSFPNSSKGQLINAKWNSNGSNIIKQFNSNSIEFINLTIENKCPPGEYMGSIIISADARRNIVFPFDLTIGNTSTMKLVEVPVFIRITPRPNATAYCANGKLKHENFHLSSSRR